MLLIYHMDTCCSLFCSVQVLRMVQNNEQYKQENFINCHDVG